MEQHMKNIKSSILNITIRVVDASPFSRKSVGMLIRFFHMAAPFLFALLLLLSNHKAINYTILIVMLAISSLFLFFRGCILSMIENKLLDDGFNVMDPFLELLNIPITNANRIYITQRLGTLYILFISVLVYINVS